jgi:hypothetical protein
MEHILEHPEMAGMERAIEETLHQPDRVIESLSDPAVHLYYRVFFRTVVGGKFLCVVVKVAQSNPLVITAYLTDRLTKGARIWPKPSDV